MNTAMNNRMGKHAKKMMAANGRQNKDIVDDILNGDLDEDVHLGRVIRTIGFGKCRVFYLNKGVPCIVEATIRNKFGGGGRKGVPIQTGSIIILADTQLAGPSRYQIISMLGQDNLHTIRKILKIDGRLLDVTLLDETTIMSVRVVADDDGYEFDTEDVETQEKDAEINIDAI